MQLRGRRLHCPRVTVADVTHVVNTVEIAFAFVVVQVLALTEGKLQRAAFALLVVHR